MIILILISALLKQLKQGTSQRHNNTRQKGKLQRQALSISYIVQAVKTSQRTLFSLPQLNHIQNSLNKRVLLSLDIVMVIPTIFSQRIQNNTKKLTLLKSFHQNALAGRIVLSYIFYEASMVLSFSIQMGTNFNCGHHCSEMDSGYSWYTKDGTVGIN